MTETCQIPSQIGPYAIRAKLGRGATADVFEAVHPLLNRRVAIKRLRVVADSPNRAEMLQRFVQEGRSLAQLGHHCIVRVYDLVATLDDVYIVLEHVDGVDLASVAKMGPLPFDVAAIIGTSLAAALAQAHFHSIIHRDIKPANVMISRAGEVKLTDFGVARDQTQVGLTATGMVVGTPRFMAPEVVEGQKGNAQSDIYSVGATLYQCLSGRALYQDAPLHEVFAKIARGQYTPLKKLVPQVPELLATIVHTCLARRPRDRFQSADELRHALDMFLGSYSSWTHHAARLIALLHERGFINDAQALKSLDAVTLQNAKQTSLRRPSRGLFARLGAKVASPY